MKILSGIQAPSDGEILIDGRPVVLKRAQDAMDAGIETVYQDLALVDTMTAYQNVYLGREELSKNPLARLFNLVDDRQMRERAREVLNALQVKIPSINVSVKGMSGGQRQCLAIARALLWGRRIVILDEPTAALGVRETGQVLEVIRDLREARCQRHRGQPQHAAGDERRRPDHGDAARALDRDAQCQGYRGQRDRRPHHRRHPGGFARGARRRTGCSLRRGGPRLPIALPHTQGGDLMSRNITRVIGMMALSAPAVLGLAGVAEAQDKFKLGMAVGGNTCCEWMKAQGDVARALAEKEGWDYVELSNNNDPATALKNAQIFVQEGVDAVIQFNGQPSSNPAISAVLKQAKIPVVTYDIADPGMYFVGIDNLAAGIAGGEGLGKLVKEKWDCNPDLVISAEGAAAGIVNEWRTGGMRTGLKNICPDIPDAKWVSFESQGDAAVGLPAARDLLAAHPEAKKMAVVGLNDGGVLSLINAAEQLGRADEVHGLGPGRRLHHRRQRQPAPRRARCSTSSRAMPSTPSAT